MTGAIGDFARASLNASTTIVYNGTDLDEGRAMLLDGEAGRRTDLYPLQFHQQPVGRKPGLGPGVLPHERDRTVLFIG